MQLEERANNRKQRLEKEAVEIKNEIRRLPQGTLECHRCRDGYKWYVVKKHQRKYLRKKELQLAEQLAYKHRLRIKLDNMQQEMTALNMFIQLSENITNDNSKAIISSRMKNGKKKIIRVGDLVSNDNRLSANNPEIERLAGLYYDSIHPEIKEWQTAEYEQLEWKKDDKKVGTLSGNKTVSKDEAIIENILISHGLPIRKDPELRLSGEDMYPDWEIMDPRTGKTIYWEHFGMMDRPDYLYKNSHKIKVYLENGYYPMVNFIATFMGGPYRIDSQLIEWIVEYFFE